MKYIKQPKRHIVLDEFEWRALVKGINDYRKQVIDEDGCVEVGNKLLIKIIDAPTKKIKVWEGSKGRMYLSGKLESGDRGTTTISKKTSRRNVLSTRQTAEEIIMNDLIWQ